jgi:hypothetical protein
LNIIPGEAFDQLSEDEQHYWHPHNFEILSGQLTLPAAKNELKVMEQKLNSYGKIIPGEFKGESKPLDGVKAKEGCE